MATSPIRVTTGNQTQVINARGIIQLTAYDALHRTTSVTQSCQNPPPASSCGTQTSDQNVLASQAYDQAGEVLTTTDPLMRLNVYTYDALGRKASQTINCTSYNSGTSSCNGSPVTSSQNLTTQWQYDAHGDVLKETSPRQCTSSAPCYQGATGTSLTDGGNLATGYTYDGLFRLASVTEDQSHAPGLVTTYAYDPSGNKLSQTDGLGTPHTTTYAVDNLGRVTSVTDAGNPTPNVVRTNYSLAGEVVSTVNARGNTNANTLDRVGRVTGLSYYKADGVTPLTRSFAYDPDSNMISFADTDVGSTTITYDHLNRVSTVTGPSPVCPTAISYTTTYTYFLDGAVNTVCDATGTTTYGEDHLGQVASMVDPLTGGTTTYSYDVAGRLVSRTEANGIVTTAGYTGADHLASKTEVTGSTTLASWTSITYDLDQNRTAETLTYYAANPYPDSHSGTATYQYDSVDQLSQALIPGVSTATYGFDAAHNLTANAGTTQTYNTNESLQTVGAVTIGSDADGNELHDTNGNTLSWNSLSQLEAFSTSEIYTYDALGRLTKVVNGGSMTQFVYRGLSRQAIEELNGTGGVIRSYAWDTGRQLYVKIGSSSYYEITNPHGDVAALASATDLIGTVHYDGWGNAFTPAGTSIPYGFQGSAGSWTDATTGFVSMGARWYYPKVGGFLSSDRAAGTADPRTPIDGLRWLYGTNDPLDNTDPTGLSGSCTQFNSQGDPNACYHGSAASKARNTDREAKRQVARTTCDATCLAIEAHARASLAAKGHLMCTKGGCVRVSTTDNSTLDRYFAGLGAHESSSIVDPIMFVRGLASDFTTGHADLALAKLGVVGTLAYLDVVSGGKVSLFSEEYQAQEESKKYGKAYAAGGATTDFFNATLNLGLALSGLAMAPTEDLSLATRVGALDSRANQLTSLLNIVGAHENPIGIASGFDREGALVTFVAQKAGRVSNKILASLRPGEYAVLNSSSPLHAEISANEAARAAGLTSIVAAARPNLICVDCEVSLVRSGTIIASPTRSERFASSLSQLLRELGQDEP